MGNPSREHQPLAEGMRPRPIAELLSEQASADRIRLMFSRIAPHYDFLNHLLSFSFDRLWRWRVASRFRRFLTHSNARVLDLCCGTGDLTFAFDRVARSVSQGPVILGCDFAHPMLVLAQEKTRKAQAANLGHTMPAGAHGAPHRGSERNLSRVPTPSGSRGLPHCEGNKDGPSAPEGDDAPSRPDALRTGFLGADALRLPFAAETFDLVSGAFGFRNLANYEKGLREIWRVLKPGGWTAILEFSLPPNRLWRYLFGLYFRHILPRVGTAISGVRGPYEYLPDSVYVFPLREKLVRMMESAGFVDATFEEWTGGVVALHTARRPE
jgi:demethylmenaquinone methyltransferase/2-methoxy-6-polyprenyl-1,4-benzoquinol methylase